MTDNVKPLLNLNLETCMTYSLVSPGNRWLIVYERIWVKTELTGEKEFIKQL